MPDATRSQQSKPRNEGRTMESALVARTTCNANPARGHHQELTTRKLLSVFMKYRIEVLDFGLQACSWKPKENDAGVGESLLKDQLAEIGGGDDQNPLLFP